LIRCSVCSCRAKKNFIVSRDGKQIRNKKYWIFFSPSCGLANGTAGPMPPRQSQRRDADATVVPAGQWHRRTDARCRYHRRSGWPMAQLTRCHPRSQRRDEIPTLCRLANGTAETMPNAKMPIPRAGWPMAPLTRCAAPPLPAPTQRRDATQKN
jgi:hypothetical protein